MIQTTAARIGERLLHLMEEVEDAFMGLATCFSPTDVATRHVEVVAHQQPQKNCIPLFLMQIIWGGQCIDSLSDSLWRAIASASVPHRLTNFQHDYAVTVCQSDNAETGPNTEVIA
ncbi:hypothetical protein [Stenotrophomonas rhizophila]|uniref:hypothetical protein n=1 Tax=Stenotrophomonas rhizophila TaxID=216778 RepID=UPI0028AF59E3|nr:hypothetical protein [Stenotrophomonas rhizophila]